MLVKSRAEVDHVLDVICGAGGGAQTWLYWEALTGRMLTFFAESAVIGAAFAILLTVWVAVTLPPSCKGFEAAAFTGKLYPQQSKTVWVIGCVVGRAYVLINHFPPHSWPQLQKCIAKSSLEFGKWLVSQTKTAEVKKEIWRLRETFLALQGSNRHPSAVWVVSCMDSGKLRNV